MAKDENEIELNDQVVSILSMRGLIPEETSSDPDTVEAWWADLEEERRKAVTEEVLKDIEFGRELVAREEWRKNKFKSGWRGWLGNWIPAITGIRWLVYAPDNQKWWAIAVFVGGSLLMHLVINGYDSLRGNPKKAQVPKESAAEATRNLGAYWESIAHERRIQRIADLEKRMKEDPHLLAAWDSLAVEYCAEHRYREAEHALKMCVTGAEGGGTGATYFYQMMNMGLFYAAALSTRVRGKGIAVFGYQCLSVDASDLGYTENELQRMSKEYLGRALDVVQDWNGDEREEARLALRAVESLVPSVFGELDKHVKDMMRRESEEEEESQQENEVQVAHAEVRAAEILAHGKIENYDEADDLAFSLTCGEEELDEVIRSLRPELKQRFDLANRLRRLKKKQLEMERRRG